MFTTCSSPVLILEVMRDRSIRRRGRMGVDVFVVLVLCFSSGLVILDRGAKIPRKRLYNSDYFWKISVFCSNYSMPYHIWFDRWNTGPLLPCHHSFPLVCPVPLQPRGLQRTLCCRRIAGFQPAYTDVWMYHSKSRHRLREKQEVRWIK